MIHSCKSGLSARKCNPSNRKVGLCVACVAARKAEAAEFAAMVARRPDTSMTDAQRDAARNSVACKPGCDCDACSFVCGTVRT